MLPSPLAPYTAAADYAPLPTDKLNPDGKSLVNPPRDGLSDAYHTFPAPIDPSNNGYDFHGKCTLDLSRRWGRSAELHRGRAPYTHNSSAYHLHLQRRLPDLILSKV